MDQYMSQSRYFFFKVVFKLVRYIVTLSHRNLTIYNGVKINVIFHTRFSYKTLLCSYDALHFYRLFTDFFQKVIIEMFIHDFAKSRSKNKAIEIPIKAITDVIASLLWCQASAFRDEL